MTQAQREELNRYDWPGNVRELQNVIERAAILAAHGPFVLNLDPRHSSARSSSPKKFALPELGSLARLEDNEKQMITAALKQARGKIYGSNGAAVLLGIKPTTLASQIISLGLRREDFTF